MSALAQWAVAARPCSLQRVPDATEDAAGTIRGQQVAAPGKGLLTSTLAPGPRPMRSTIGCFACALLLVACAIDYGGGTIDFLDWPGATAAMLLLTGLPHGALDIEVLRVAVHDTFHFSLMRALLVYAGIAASVLLLWWFLPAGALVFFLLLSAYHFGGDWTGFETAAERLIVGACLLSAPVLFHETSVALIFSWLVAGETASAVARDRKSVV